MRIGRIENKDLPSEFRSEEIRLTGRGGEPRVSGNHGLCSRWSPDNPPSRDGTSLASIPFNPRFLTHLQPAYGFSLTCFRTRSPLIPRFTRAHQSSSDFPVVSCSHSWRVGKKAVNLSRVMCPHEMKRRLDGTWEMEPWYAEWRPFSSATGGDQRPQANVARLLFSVRLLPAADQEQHLPPGGRRAILWTRWAVTAWNRGDITARAHEWRFRRERSVCVFVSFKNKTSTLCLGLGAMAASSPSRPETSSWRRWATLGTIPASSVP